jgi:hypothetical protein
MKKIIKEIEAGNEIFREATAFLDKGKMDFFTPQFGYSSYTPPHTMFQISNDLPEILLKLPLRAQKIYLKILTKLRRSHTPELSIIMVVSPEDFKDVVKKSSYYRGLKDLINEKLLITTKRKNTFIVNYNYAHKLFKPKLDL